MDFQLKTSCQSTALPLETRSRFPSKYNFGLLDLLVSTAPAPLNINPWKADMFGKMNQWLSFHSTIAGQYLRRNLGEL
jgi:hypothetical protein